MQSCAVVGSGRMGAGIAHALLLTGASVTVIEATQELGEAGRERVAALVNDSAVRETLTQAVSEVLARLTCGVGAQAAAGSDLVVEAVPEDPALKVSVLADIEAVVDQTCMIATNTSSISVTELAAALDRPERFIGLHFFNPVPASALVEIVVGVQTSNASVDAARAVVDSMGKTAIVVRDSPGFASSRLGVLLGLEAIRMVEEGVASPADIDAAMTLGYKHPMGPLRLTDLVGLDVRLGVAEYLAAVLGDRFSPPQLMRDMVARGELGKKSGRGFYDW